MMDAFVKSIVWEDAIFAITARGEIYRIWYSFTFEHGPMVQMLLGSEPEFAEPIVKLKRFDMLEYLSARAQRIDRNLWVYPEPYRTNADSRIFMISHCHKPGTAAISISGLEEIQNSDYMAMADLLNTRFDNALKALEKCHDGAQTDPTPSS